MRAGALGLAPDHVQIVDEDGNEKARARLDERGRVLNADEWVGEIVNTQGVGPFEGYYNNADATEKTTRFGWYWSGDLGYKDADGFLYFAGRNADWIRVDGENFPAGPIEEALRQAPGVVLAAVYGVPDDQAGDQVMAGLVLADGVAFDPAAFTAWLEAEENIGPEVAAAVRAHPAGSAHHRHEQDREAHARAPEVPTRSRRRRSRCYVRDRGDDVVPTLHRRRRSRARASPSCTTGANGSGTSDVDLSSPRTRTRSHARCGTGWRRTSTCRPVSSRSPRRSSSGSGGRPSSRPTRWVGIHWPDEYGGRSATPVQVAIFNMEYARSRALQPINRVGINLAGPTLLAHGTDEQKQRWLPSILTAAEIWCQLFCEPDAGSDLASLQTRAVRVDDGWLLSGQKVWTSYAQFARWGICLARTDPDAPKHKGISYLVVDMQAPGIEVRPLVQITGDAEFNEVFFDEVFVPDDQLVGGLHNGWAVANTTLAHERGTAFPFKEQVVHEVYLDELWQLAAERGLLDDVEIADGLAQSFVELRVLRLHNWRTLSRLTQGIEPGPESSVTKLAWTDMTQALSARGARRGRVPRRRCGGARTTTRAAASGNASGCGRRRRRSRAAPARSSARSSATGCWGFRAEPAPVAWADA